MIIRKVRLAPFGAVTDKTYHFKKGLNVLVGPNEAGKSTLINAIYAALFIPPNVKKSSDDWKNLILNYLPYPAGDTARVEIEFEDGEWKANTYSCAWGGSREERLLAGDGSEINDPATIRQCLAKALRFGLATYRDLLFTRQEEINRTFKKLEDNPEATGTVSGLLRAALYETGGVSLEKLEQHLSDEHNRLLQNWDLERNGPRGGRDLNNPHKRGIGAVLEAYYRREEAAKKLRDTESKEEQIAALNKELSGLNRDQDQLTGRLKEMEALEDDARERSGLEPTLESLQGQEAVLKNVINEWPRVEERVHVLDKEIKESELKISLLQSELREAEQILRARQKKELLGKIRPLHEAIRQKEEELAALLPINRNDLKYLEQKNQEQDRLKAVAGAMKLRAALYSKKPLDLNVIAGLDEPRSMSVLKETTFEGSGRLILESEDWKINIQAGEEDVEQLIEKSRQAGDDFTARLKKFSLNSLEEARALLSKREDLEAAVESTRIRLEDQLGELSLDELEADAAAAGPDKAVREPEQIKAEIEETRVALGTSNYKLDRENERLETWQREYESLDRALDELGGLKQQTLEIIKKLDHLAPLPAEYATGDQFITALKEMRTRARGLQDQIFSLKTELSNLQNRMPEESTEELQAALDLAGDELEKLKCRGQAIDSIWNEFIALKEELDADTYAPLVQSFTDYLALATSNRYSLAELEGALPGRITSAEGKTLPLHLLSAGTTSGAALALRLAMAEYLLQDANGFLVMDDPLVNLDLERKQSAARAVRQFASRKQVIVATCDLNTAELMGGNIIYL